VSNNVVGPTKGPMIPPEISDALGEPALLRGENPKEFAKLLEMVAATVRPRDAFEWFYVYDIATARWEIKRLNRFEAQLVADSRAKKFEHSLSSLWSSLNSQGSKIAASFRTGMETPANNSAGKSSDMDEQITAAAAQKIKEQVAKLKQKCDVDADTTRVLEHMTHKYLSGDDLFAINEWLGTYMTLAGLLSSKPHGNVCVMSLATWKFIVAVSVPGCVR